MVKKTFNYVDAMKKTHSYLLIAALSCLLLANACMKEVERASDASEEVPEALVHLTIHTGETEVKTYIDETGPKWYNGDNLGVFFDSWSAGETAVDGTLSNSAGDAEKAAFEGDVPVEEGNHTVYAFYPARAFYGTEANKIVDLEIPYIQFPTATSFDPKADLLVSVPKNVEISGENANIENMQFRRVGAVLKVKLTDDTGSLSTEKVKSVKIESSVVDLAGVFRYDFANENAAATQILDASAKKHVTADYTESPVAFDSDIYLITNPVTLTSGSTLTFTVLTEGHEVVKEVTLSKDIELKSSKIKTINLTLNNTCTITHVYFQDNFDWVYKYWDAVYSSAYEKSLKNLDPVDTQTNDNNPQPNIWSTYSSSFGNAFSSIGYIDMEQLAGENRNVLYAQENYLKMCKNNNQTGIELPALNLGEIPVNVTLTFDIALNDKKDFVVEVLGRGTCADSGTSVSNTFTYSETFSWKTKELTLVGLTNSSRICIRPAVASFATSGYYRFFIDNIKVTEAASTPTPANFPVVWSFPAPSSTWVAEQDYHLEEKSFSGSYIYSDTHEGKISIVSTANDAGSSNPNYRAISNTEIKEYGMPEGMTFLHYAMGFHSYWQFEVYNVSNPAGTYNISYQMSSSNAGPAYYRLEYTLEDNWNNPIAIGATNSVEDNYNSETYVNYTYTTIGNNSVNAVSQSFYLDAVNSQTLKIRAYVVSKIRANGTTPIANNSGGTNRIYGTPTITFKPDSE